MHRRLRAISGALVAVTLAACSSSGAPSGGAASASGASPAAASASVSAAAASSVAASPSSSGSAAASASGSTTASGSTGASASAGAAETPLPPPGGSLITGCAQGATKGPKGETGVPASQVTLTDDEISKVKTGNYKAAILWHTSGDFVNALSRGIKDQFAKLNIQVVSETDANFDAATQANQVETVMALNPDIVITLVVDPVSGAQAFRKVTSAGKKLVLISNVPQGYEHGKDYVGVVSDDFFGMGSSAADLMGKALNKTGKVGYIFHDADYYVTNQRDQSFKTVLGQCFPNMQVVAQQGMADPAKGQEIASAMLTQHPDLNGIYVPWDQPAEGVVAAIRDSSKKDLKVVTMDLGANNDLEMAQGGVVYGKAVDLPYEAGITVATEGAYGMLGKEAPPFAMVPAIEVTKDNLADAYQQSFRIDPPDAVKKALGG
ncbi:MAG: substrate-binding domain-containing protein [Chloroflexota bacterium]